MRPERVARYMLKYLSGLQFSSVRSAPSSAIPLWVGNGSHVMGFRVGYHGVFLSRVLRAGAVPG